MSGTTDTLVEELAAGEYDYIETDELHEHPKNSEVYGEVDPNETFVEDIERNGVETPLVVNEHEDSPNTVIGGHRRLEAAKRAGLNRVPVKWVNYPEPMATRRLVLNNNQRDKTPKQQSQEALVLEETARKAAKENQATSQGGSNQHRLNLDEGDSARWDEEVSEQIGVGKDTIRKGTDIFRMAYPEKYVHDDLRNKEKYDVPEEVREVAREQVEAMDDDQTFHGAHTEVKDAIEEHEREQTVQSISESVASDSEEEDEESIDVSPGDVWELGDHILYCGDTADESFTSLVEEWEHDNAAFAFADPPYAAGVAEWDDDESEAFDWEHDWLHDVSDIVAVTPGIVSIFDFAQRTTMPYQWSVASWIKNGMTRGDLGFGNWIYIALFADEDTSLHRDSQDVARVTVKTSETDETDHKGRKPSELMVWLLERFTDDGDTVVDPFAGSGSTLFAAEEMGRTCITGDLDPEFCADIINRWNESHPDREASLWGDDS